MQEKRTDANDRILELIRGRLELGRVRYGHGILLDDDTRAYTTTTTDAATGAAGSSNSWTLMALEEALDMAVYLAARLVQILEIEAAATAAT